MKQSEPSTDPPSRSLGATAWGRALIDALRHWLAPSHCASYRPERHYMRGAGARDASAVPSSGATRD